MLQDLKLEVSLGAVTLCSAVSVINIQNAVKCVSSAWGECMVGCKRDKGRALFFKKTAAVEVFLTQAHESELRNGRSPPVFFCRLTWTAPAS